LRHLRWEEAAVGLDDATRALPVAPALRAGVVAAQNARSDAGRSLGKRDLGVAVVAADRRCGRRPAEEAHAVGGLVSAGAVGAAPPFLVGGIGRRAPGSGGSPSGAGGSCFFISGTKPSGEAWSVRSGHFSTGASSMCAALNSSMRFA